MTQKKEKEKQKQEEETKLRLELARNLDFLAVKRELYISLGEEIYRLELEVDRIEERCIAMIYDWPS